jgi:hypothetical protein
MNICIAGNCQAQHMEMMLGVGNQDLSITRLPPVFLMKPDEKDDVYARFAAADVIFMQRISNEYGIDWIASSAVKDSFGDRVTIWPNIYFDGYFPGVQYVYLPNWGKLLSPLGEYHFAQVRAAHAAGQTAEEALNAFAGDALFEAAPDPIAESLNRLRTREADVDVPISDVIEERHARERQFYTPNHPVNALLARMIERLAQRHDIAFDAPRAIAAPYRLDECDIATSPAIVRRFALPFDHDTHYRGRELLAVEPHQVTLGGPKDYSARDLVDAFYRLYDVVAAHA